MYQRAEDSLVTKFSSNHRPALRQIKNVMKFGKARSWLCRMHVNPLNAELNPIYHLLALLGAHHILHVSRGRVKPEKIKKEIIRSIRNEIF
jgi:hypothetical protein